MTKRDKLTVEIFRDKDTPSMSIDSIIDGVEHLTKITNRLDIAEAVNFVKFDKKSGAIDIDAIDAPKRADINVYLTNSPIDYVAENGRRILGFSRVSPDARSLIGYRMAVISLYRNKNSALTASHEIAHALNVKEFGHNTDGQGHCIDLCCTMNNGTQSSAFKERINNVMFRTAGKLIGHSDVTDSTNGFFSTKTFCPDCIEETNGNTDLLIDVLHGKSVGSHRVFPSFFRNLIETDE